MDSLYIVLIYECKIFLDMYSKTIYTIYIVMKTQAPINALTLIGAESAQPKPYRCSSLIIRLLAVDLKRRFTMTCHNCRIECKRHGKDRRGHQRYQCHQCRKTFLEPQEKPLEGMYLPVEKAEMVIRLLLEGNSVSSVERLTEVHHTTILKLLVLAGDKERTDHGREDP